MKALLSDLHSLCGCRLPADPGSGQEISASVAGLAVSVAATCVPAACALVLAPTDLQLQVSRDDCLATMAVLLSMGAVTASLSTAAVQALSSLAAVLTAAASIARPAVQQRHNHQLPPSPAAHRAAVHSRQECGDLGCGLFSLSPVLAGRPGAPLLPRILSRRLEAHCLTSGEFPATTLSGVSAQELQLAGPPRLDGRRQASSPSSAMQSDMLAGFCAAGPMQISLGDGAAGEDGCWLCWRYSHGRPVMRLLLRGGAQQLAGVSFGLSCCDAVSGEVLTPSLHALPPADAGNQSDLVLEVQVSL